MPRMGRVMLPNYPHHVLGLGEEVSGLGRLMKRVAGRQTRYHNTLEGRTGMLWEGRYKSIPVDSDAYLLACVRYIELNPVRARMVEAPEQYPWSSARHHLGIERCDWLDENPGYVALGNDALERQVSHRTFLTAAIPEGEWMWIRTAVQRGQLTGSGRFIDEVEHVLGRRIEHRKPGRPTVRPDK